MSENSSQRVNTDGGGAIGGNVGTGGGSFAGRDSDVTVNVDRGDHAADLVDRLEERIEIQIDRLSDSVCNRINNMETKIDMRLVWIERDIDELRRAPSRFLIPLLTIIATLLMIAALYYFGGGLYSLSNELKQQRIEMQKSGVVGKPPGFTWAGR